ncbi:hypothetical protein GCM10010319_38670 [Streptomyces blastmyceticus]|uniref:Transposase n=1 Tax=Streptomyces blastmyceticus TaxID=68180 RepID=A0ABP3H2C4_9ACTN
MQSSHGSSGVSVAFDESNLVANAGLVSLVRLAERRGLPDLVADRLRITSVANSAGAMNRLFAGVRAPSILGSFLRAFTHAHVRQLHAVHREFLARLAHSTPLLPGVGQVAFVDVDPTHRRVFGYAKQGAKVGRLKGQWTLHPILATLSTPLARPVIAAVRLRRGKAADARGAGPFTGEALAAARQAGATGTVVVRADSQFHNADVTAACRRAGAASRSRCG